MSKTLKYVFVFLNLIIGLFFASSLAWLDYKMIVIFGLIMLVGIFTGGELRILSYISWLPMFFIFICKLSVFYSFKNQIFIGQSFQYIFQGFALLVAVFVFIVNFIKIKREW